MVVQKAEFNKSGRNASVVKMKLKNLLSGSGTETVYRADEKFDLVQLERKEVTYSYFHDPAYVFMDAEYNQIEVDEDGRIVFFEEKPSAARTTLSGVALYYYPRRALPLVKQYLEEGNNPDQPGRLVEWLYARTAFYTWLLPGEWYDIGSAETLAEADSIFSQSRDP